MRSNTENAALNIALANYGTAAQIATDQYPTWEVTTTNPYSGSYDARCNGASCAQLDQTLATTAGTNYLLSFAFDGTGSVYWDGTDIDNITNSGWTVYTLDVTGAGSDGLGFSGSIVGLDDVSLSSAVPGPIAGAGLPGLIFGSGGLLAWWRRKRKAQAVA